LINQNQLERFVSLSFLCFIISTPVNPTQMMPKRTSKNKEGSLSRRSKSPPDVINLVGDSPPSSKGTNNTNTNANVPQPGARMPESQPVPSTSPGRLDEDGELGQPDKQRLQGVISGLNDAFNLINQNQLERFVSLSFLCFFYAAAFCKNCFVALFLFHLLLEHISQHRLVSLPSVRLIGYRRKSLYVSLQLIMSRHRILSP